MIASLLSALSLASAIPHVPQCTPATGDAVAILHRAADVIGLTRAQGRVVRQRATDIVQHDFESDRTYPPYLAQSTPFDEWFDPATGADRISTGESVIGGYQYQGFTIVSGPTATYAVRDTALVPNAELHASAYTTRPLNAWAMLHDWRAAGDARVVERCDYREYPRLVLVRRGLRGDERLYVDPKSGYPVALMRNEPHYLWGQQRVEYVYSTWSRIGEAHLPGGAFRIVDGETEIARSFGGSSLIARDSAPALTLPAHGAPMTLATAAFLVPSRPDTIRVSANTFLLKNPGYAETVTLAHDTVFVFDATQGDGRARQDSAWIGALFPGRHPIAVVVTDLAWPHVAGVRYWVAQGATIFAPRSARAFLQRVVNHRWTDAPDLLETRRARAPRLRFVPVGDSLQIGGGAITLFGIDGVSSEIALAAHVHADRFLWASDFIQTLSRPTQYLDEVAAAVRRMGYEPLNVAAEHLPLSPWQKVARLAEQPVP